MSRSRYWLNAFADPAVSIPPIKRRDDQPQRREAARGEHHRRDGRDEQQRDDARLRQTDVRHHAIRRSRSPRGGGGSSPAEPSRVRGRTRATTASATNAAHVTNASVAWPTTAAGCELRPHVRRADERLREERRDATEARRSARPDARHVARASATPIRCPATSSASSRCAKCSPAPGASNDGSSFAVHERPVVEREPGPLLADVATDDEQRKQPAERAVREPRDLRAATRPARGRSYVNESAAIVVVSVDEARAR